LLGESRRKIAPLISLRQASCRYVGETRLVAVNRIAGLPDVSLARFLAIRAARPVSSEPPPLAAAAAPARHLRGEGTFPQENIELNTDN